MTKASLLDRVIREISPRMAARRLYAKSCFDNMDSSNGLGYSASIDSRLRTHHAFGRSLPMSEDALVGPWGRDTLRLEARDLMRNNEIAAGIVNRYCDYTVWLGIIPQAATSDTVWNKRADKWWTQQYVRTVDARQRDGVDMTEFQKLIIRARVTDGDVGFILQKNGQLMPVESERIKTPPGVTPTKNTKIVDGVKLTTSGQTLGYFVHGRDINGNVGANFKFIPRENFIFCMRPFRFDQVRGIPGLAPAINKLRDYDSTDQYVLNKVKNDAMQLFKRFVDSEGSANDIPRGGYEVTDEAGKDPLKVEKHEWGQVHNLKIGENMEPMDSKTPNGQYVAYMEWEIKAISAALDLPFEYVMMIFTNGSFSAQRAAMLHAKHTFMREHDWLTRCFNQRVWNWRIAKAMNDGVLPFAPIDPQTGISEWHKVVWSTPAIGWVDPDKQAKADDANIRAGRMSLTSAVRNSGGDLSITLKDKQGDIRMAKELAGELNTDGDTNGFVHWRDIADIGSTKGSATAPSES